MHVADKKPDSISEINSNTVRGIRIVIICNGPFYAETSCRNQEKKDTKSNFLHKDLIDLVNYGMVLEFKYIVSEIIIL